MWVRGLKRNCCPKSYKSNNVAPYVGAWIETYTTEPLLFGVESHPMWVRGLKQSMENKTFKQLLSHPMWVRGLKPRNNFKG